MTHAKARRHVDLDRSSQAITLMRGLCLLGHRAMTSCRGALGLSDPTWYIRLSPVSEDKGQYSMPRGGQSQAVSSGFEPAKVLVRGHRYPDRCAFRDHLGSLPVLRPTRGVGQHSTPGGLVAIRVGVSGEEGGFLLGLYSQPASAALALRSHTHSGQPKRATPFRARAALFRPHVVPISEVISLWDPSAIRRSDSGKVVTYPNKPGQTGASCVQVTPAPPVQVQIIHLQASSFKPEPLGPLQRIRWSC
ncbi:hypothetical protein EDB84DRAFT_883802 [Lactarius hengduanensis]|nr:hypothetical protein EDB84DRAFT_883802 [Lactarius hengduanensis]